MVMLVTGVTSDVMVVFGDAVMLVTGLNDDAMVVPSWLGSSAFFHESNIKPPSVLTLEGHSYRPFPACRYLVFTRVLDGCNLDT
jgi:hypothetical protein